MLTTYPPVSPAGGESQFLRRRKQDFQKRSRGAICFSLVLFLVVVVVVVVANVVAVVDVVVIVVLGGCCAWWVFAVGYWLVVGYCCFMFLQCSFFRW